MYGSDTTSSSSTARPPHLLGQNGAMETLKQIVRDGPLGATLYIDLLLRRRTVTHGVVFKPALVVRTGRDLDQGRGISSRRQAREGRLGATLLFRLGQGSYPCHDADVGTRRRRRRKSLVWQGRGSHGGGWW